MIWCGTFHVRYRMITVQIGKSCVLGVASQTNTGCGVRLFREKCFECMSAVDVVVVHRLVSVVTRVL